MTLSKLFYIIIVLLAGVYSCTRTEKKLPVLGEAAIRGSDTTYPQIADFSFTDQDGNAISNNTFANKIYVADFIFLSCPTICPRMTDMMHATYQVFENDERVSFLSHSIDPERDSIAALKIYANNLNVPTSRWHFVTGTQDSVTQLAEHSYFSAAFPDSTAPGGFTHSGGILLIDKQRHIRGVYNSMQQEEKSRLINDIHSLLKEQF
jgi:protein SCO1